MAKTPCDWTVERLPWWANETLEEGEAERVAAHLDDCAACRAELAATREAMALYAAHLPIETLLDLAEGGSDAAAGGGAAGAVSRAAVQAHLGHCAECREELALLHESRAAVAAEPGEEGATVAAFTKRRAAAPGAAGRRRFDRRAVALAASILVAVVAAGGWLLSDQAADERGERLAELERRFAEVTAAEPGAGARSDTPADEPAADDEASLAAREAEIERLERQIAQLEATIETGEGAAPEGDRSAALVGAASSWDVRRVVVRGAEPPPADEVETIDAGAATTYSYYVTGAGDRPLRMVVEDVSTGRRLYETPAVPPFEVGDSGPHVMIAVPLAELPAGTVRVRLFSGGEELGSRLLRVER